MNRSPLLTLLMAGAFLLFNKVCTAQSLGMEMDDIIKVSGVTATSQISTLSIGQKQTTRQYFDGLGRPLQVVVENASPLQHDVIQPVAYDNLGRDKISYLPYADQSSATTGSYRPNAISTDQPNFYYNTSQYLIPVDGAAYKQKVFEDSPLQRVLKEGMVGAGFQPGVSGNFSKTASYRPNNSSTDGNILQWNPDGTYTSSTYYANNTLNVTDATNEENIETLVFTDLAGRTILKRQILSPSNLDTYYIYDNAGLLIYVVPPKATALLATNSYNLTVAPLSKLAFHYVYDNPMGRLVEQTVPAKGTSYIVYDPVNRPVLVQDANMRTNNNWAYVKYDAKGRAVSQGIYNDGTHTTLSSMQSYVSGLSYTVWYESRSSTVTNSGYYTNNVFPTTGITPNAYAYYDNYYMTGGTSPDFSYISQGLAGEVGATTAAVKGMPTMVSKATVGAGLSGIWLTKVTFYDKRGNVIQTQSNNQLNYSGATTLTDVATSVPDFTGVPLITLVKKVIGSGSGNTTTVQTTMSYDHANRPLTINQQYNGGTVKGVAAYVYNEIGQVIQKRLGQLSTAYLQNVDLRYNIRGQLLNINNSKLSNDGGITNNDANDLFGMEMLYDKTDANLGNTARHDGNLTAVKWMSKDGGGTSTYERSLSYHYDGVNRYDGSTYAERTPTGTTFNTNVGGFDESGITYDEGGNIKFLNRNSSSPGPLSGPATTQIDLLTYTYDATNPNQLYTVTDGTGSNYTGGGFKNLTGHTTGYYYQYDLNGNLTNDPYKGLTIDYNYLNRTNKITVTSTKYINYTYDAGGALIRKQVYDTGTLQNTTDYIDGFVYTSTGAGSSSISYFPMPEGRVLNNGGGTLAQEFIITDQQGNARVSFQDNGSGTAQVKQENSYYGFGLPMSSITMSGTPNKKLYNGGSEWQNDYSNLPDYMQTFYRNYDAALGRFVGVDPMAESAESLTSYNYAGNNPIMGNDPNGDVTLEQMYLALSLVRNSDKVSYYIGPKNTGSNGDLYTSLSDADATKLGQDYISRFGGVDHYMGYDGHPYTFVTLNGTNTNNLYMGAKSDQNSVYVDHWVLVKSEAAGSSIGKAKEENFEGPSNQANWLLGIVSSTTQNFSGVARVGKDLIYTATASGRVFMGNQYVETFSLAKAGGVLGKLSFGAGVALDGVGVIYWLQNPKSPNAIHPAKAGLDIAMGAFGMTGIGTIPAIIYFGLDAFHKDGIVGAVSDYEKNVYPHYGELMRDNHF